MLKIGNTFINEDLLEAISPGRGGNEGFAVAHMKSGRMIPLGVSIEKAEAVLYQADLITVLDGGYTPVYDMSDEERVKLMELYDEGFRYLARDKTTDFLYAYRHKPAPRVNDWVPSVEETPARVHEDFAFVSAEDAEPVSIADALTWEAACDD